MRETIDGLPHTVATFRFVVSLFVVLTVAFVVGQWYTQHTIEAKSAEGARALAAESQARDQALAAASRARVQAVNKINKTQCEAIGKLRSALIDTRQADIVRSKQFLLEHPNGIDGITPELIQEGIDATKADIARLKKTGCAGSIVVPTG